MQSKTTAKDFFLYLGILIGLYVSTVSFLALVFGIIDKLLPLAGEYTGGFDGMIRSSIAALIIFFPAFLYLGYLAFTDLKMHPEKKEMWVRKWAIFSTLFVAGLAIAIDLAVLVYRFLGAEDLSLRFFLKVFFVFAATAMIFRLYFYELKRDPATYDKLMKVRLGLMTVVRVATIIIGIVLIGSPALQRARLLDSQRVNDLANIQNEIVYTQWENTGAIPETLAALTNPISGFTVPTDPATGAAYGYQKLASTSFELCADFQAASDAANGPIYPASMNDNWQHAATTTCFTRTIDPKIYKVAPIQTPTK